MCCLRLSDNPPAVSRGCCLALQTAQFSGSVWAAGLRNARFPPPEMNFRGLGISPPPRACFFRFSAATGDFPWAACGAERRTKSPCLGCAVFRKAPWARNGLTSDSRSVPALVGDVGFLQGHCPGLRVCLREQSKQQAQAAAAHCGDNKHPPGGTDRGATRTSTRS